MDLDTDHFRDCVRDVLALVECCLALQDDTPDRERVTGNLQVLLDNADLSGCLRVSVSMVATVWKMLAESRAQGLSTDAQAELDQILATFRSALA